MYGNLMELIMNTRLMLVAAVMAVALTSISANAGVIVSEDFGGDGSGGLNGTATDRFSPAITAAVSIKKQHTSIWVPISIMRKGLPRGCSR